MESTSDEELVQQMKDTQMDERLQEKAMMEVNRRTDGGQKESVVAALFQLSVIPLIVAALKNHEGSAGVAVGASRALSCIVSGSSERRKAAVAAGAVPLLLAVLRGHGSLAAATQSAEALGYLCLTLPEAQQEARSGGALKELREVWGAPYGRRWFAFCGFACAQGSSDEFLQLTRESEWLAKLEEYQKWMMNSDLPTLNADLAKLVEFCKEVQKTGQYPVTAGGYPAPTTPASPEAMLASGRFMAMAEEEISLLPETQWEDIKPTGSLLEELRGNPLIRDVCPRIDQIAKDVEEKYADELSKKKSLKEVLDRVGMDGVHAILAYTYDTQDPNGKQEGNLYFELNKSLRQRNERAMMMKSWGVFVHYALRGLAAVQPYQGTVYRGMPNKEYIKEHYELDCMIEWGSFASASTVAAEAMKFIKDDGILLRIQVKSGRDVRNISFFSMENEVLLSPKCRFMVTSESKYDAELGTEVMDLVEPKDVFKS